MQITEFSDDRGYTSPKGEVSMSILIATMSLLAILANGLFALHAWSELTDSPKAQS
jgi:hypothetical protein